MATLKWTPLRHRMLRMIADGRVSRGFSASGWVFDRLDGSVKKGHADKAVSFLVSGNGYAKIVGGYRDPIALTDTGRSVLADWDAAHPVNEED